ncbi:hypothetical protein ACFSQD_01910 [Flavihumibacter stibioxidans]|uniref:Uncharacterized protein n=1 Tax=Flavihumibacter stibioxidans TaxID=1834163 RepID=A0ABR7MB21_9BACT|nr:hypothetical protein [Flavihumibacter stibioxidans]MBC6492238.1 hypothetical protein [Flavihumibacter stibioxidans]
MKKIFTISLSFLYLLVSSGLLLEVHHCMGRIAETGIAWIGEDEEDQCGKCGMDKNDEGNHCCKDEYKLVKVSSDQKPATLQFVLDAPVAILTTLQWPELYQQTVYLHPDYSGRANAPPPAVSPSKQELLCIYRI